MISRIQWRAPGARPRRWTQVPPMYDFVDALILFGKYYDLRYEEDGITKIRKADVQ
jgi:hypothetical protein